MTEPFTQWVLEDLFPAGRPRWELAGVQLVDAVGPYEQAKLRILNAAHSALAYWGLLAGHRLIWQAAADPALPPQSRTCSRREVLPTVVTPPGWDLRGYADGVIDRFANRALPYTDREGRRRRLAEAPRPGPADGRAPGWPPGAGTAAGVAPRRVGRLRGPARGRRTGVADPPSTTCATAPGRGAAPSRGAAADRLLALPGSSTRPSRAEHAYLAEARHGRPPDVGRRPARSARPPEPLIVEGR